MSWETILQLDNLMLFSHAYTCNTWTDNFFFYSDCLGENILHDDKSGSVWMCRNSFAFAVSTTRYVCWLPGMSRSTEFLKATSVSGQSGFNPCYHA